MTEQEWRLNADIRISEIQNRLSDLEKRYAVDRVILENIEKRIASMENGQTWLSRLVLAAIILGLIGQLVGSGGVT